MQAFLFKNSGFGEFLTSGKKCKISRSILHTDFVKYFPNFLITCIEVKTFALKKSSEIVEALLLKSKCITDWGFGKS